MKTSKFYKNDLENGRNMVAICLNLCILYSYWSIQWSDLKRWPFYRKTLCSAKFTLKYTWFCCWTKPHESHAAVDNSLGLSQHIWSLMLLYSTWDRWQCWCQDTSKYWIACDIAVMIGLNVLRFKNENNSVC